MSHPFFARLFCCAHVRPRRTVPAAEPTVIPNETSRLLDPPTFPATPALDRQTLMDRLGSIVRAKEGKMVSVGARAPFAPKTTSHGPDHDDASSTSNDSGRSSSTNSDMNVDRGGTLADARSPAAVIQRPRVLTMMSAAVRTNASPSLESLSTPHRDLRASDGGSVHSARSGSRSSSSHRLPCPANRNDAQGKGARIEEEEAEAFSEPPPPSLAALPIRVPRAQSGSTPANPNDAEGIAFSWSDV